MPDEFDVKKLQKITADMIAAITSPPFVDAMRRLKATPPDKRLARGATLLSPAALRKKGVKLPAGIRISSRYFEEGQPVINVTDHGAVLGDLVVLPSTAGTICGCASGGGLTFCGGAGGGG
jgi:hypothetical protein